MLPPHAPAHATAARDDAAFAPRAAFGRYVESLLTTASEFPGNARLVRRRAEVVDITAAGTGFAVELGDGERLEARAVVQIGRAHV